MGTWTIFWGGLLAVTLIGYSVLVIYVMIGGFSDIKQMFKSLGQNDEDTGDESEAEEDSES